MGKRRIVRKPVNYGHRTGTKRSDRHWTDPEGNIWDSRYEYLVFRAYAEVKGLNVRRTTKSDTMAFVLSIARGQCLACGATTVGQQRTYTPDLHVTPSDTEPQAEPYYIEAKGYLRPKERSLLRAFYKAHPDAPVRFLLQRDFPAGAKSKVTGTRSSIVQWFAKFLPQFKVVVWNGKVPKDDDWRLGPCKAAKVVTPRPKKVRLAADRGLPSTDAKRGIIDSPADNGTESTAVRTAVSRRAPRKRRAAMEAP